MSYSRGSSGSFIVADLNTKILSDAMQFDLDLVYIYMYSIQ